MNFEHIPLNTTILSFQAVPFPWLLKHKGAYLQGTIFPFSFIFHKKADDITKGSHI